MNLINNMEAKMYGDELSDDQMNELLKKLCEKYNGTDDVESCI